MATLRDLKKINRKYHIKNKKALKENVNAMWKEIFQFIKHSEPSQGVDNAETKTTNKPTKDLKKYCKYCNRWVNVEEYNVADEICYKCYNENVEDEGQETGNE